MFIFSGIRRIRRGKTVKTLTWFFWEAENKKINLEKETDILKEDNETLETKLAELKEKTFNMEREMAAAHNAEIKIHDEKMDVLKKSRRSFKAQLESLIRDDPEDLPED
ncbi:Axonemal dynein light chain [Cinara cedri]|uniref:Axonemal dynein light chain n=1 Tax=Cinara cedri TaxID=506608 RepID=A0A5E4M3P3_9HEMI|nr:Axonemal dynein light chain [Cinara cedri]